MFNFTCDEEQVGKFLSSLPARGKGLQNVRCTLNCVDGCTGVLVQTSQARGNNTNNNNNNNNSLHKIQFKSSAILSLFLANFTK